MRKNIMYSLMIKILIVIIVTLLVLILSKSSMKIKSLIKKYLYEENIDFNKYMNKYTKYFSEFIPFDTFMSERQVFNEKLEYKSLNKYLDGVNLEVTSNYLVPVIESGLVVFIGEKEGYNKTVIVQQVDGVDMWYGNLLDINIKLYDYVEKGSLLASTSNNLYLVLEREGKFIDYETY